MSGETEQSVSGWTVGTLKEYVEQRFDAQEKAVNAALVAAKQAVEKEEANSEKWRQSANEWRGSMLDRETKFASRVEVEAELKGMRAEIATLKESRADIAGGVKGRLSQQQFIIAIIALAATLMFGLIGAAGTLAFLLRR